jgi:hypothetical protein
MSSRQPYKESEDDRLKRIQLHEKFDENKIKTRTKEYFAPIYVEMMHLVELLRPISPSLFRKWPSPNHYYRNTIRGFYMECDSEGEVLRFWTPFGSIEVIHHWSASPEIMENFKSKILESCRIVDVSSEYIKTHPSSIRENKMYLIKEIIGVSVIFDDSVSLEDIVRNDTSHAHYLFCDASGDMFYQFAGEQGWVK